MNNTYNSFEDYLNKNFPSLNEKKTLKKGYIKKTDYGYIKADEAINKILENEKLEKK